MKNTKKLAALMAAAVMTTPQTGMNIYAEEARMEAEAAAQANEMGYIDKVVDATQKVETIQETLNTMETVSQEDAVAVQQGMKTIEKELTELKQDIVENAEEVRDDKAEKVEELENTLSSLETQKDNLTVVSHPDMSEVDTLTEEVNTLTKEAEAAKKGMETAQGEVQTMEEEIAAKEAATEVEEFDESALEVIPPLYETNGEDQDTFGHAYLEEYGENRDVKLLEACIAVEYSMAAYVVSVNNQVIAITEALEAENTYNNSYTTQLTSQAKLEAINNLLQAEEAGEIILDNKDEMTAEKETLEQLIPALVEQAAQDKANYETYKSKLAESFPDASEAIQNNQTVLNLISYVEDNTELQESFDNLLATFNEIHQFTQDHANLTQDFLGYAQSREQAAQAKADLIVMKSNKQIADYKAAKAEELYNQAVEVLNTTQKKLDDAIDSYNRQSNAYDGYVNELNRINNEITTAKKELEDAKGDLAKAEVILEDVKNDVFKPVEGDPAYIEYNDLVNDYLEKQNTLNELKKQHADMQDSITRREEIEKELEDAKKELEEANQNLKDYLESQKPVDEEKEGPVQEEETQKPAPNTPDTKPEAPVISVVPSAPVYTSQHTPAADKIAPVTAEVPNTNASSHTDMWGLVGMITGAAAALMGMFKKRVQE